MVKSVIPAPVFTRVNSSGNPGLNMQDISGRKEMDTRLKDLGYDGFTRNIL